MAPGAADLVRPGLDGVHVLGHQIEIFEFIHDPGRSAFLAGAIIGKQEKDGIVEVANILQKGQQAADVIVGMIQETGKGLLESQGKFFFIFSSSFQGLTPGFGGPVRSPGNNSQLN